MVLFLIIILIPDSDISEPETQVDVNENIPESIANTESQTGHPKENHLPVSLLKMAVLHTQRHGGEDNICSAIWSLEVEGLAGRDHGYTIEVPDQLHGAFTVIRMLRLILNSVSLYVWI